MAITVRQIHRYFVGEVSGAELTRPQTPEEIGIIRDAIDRLGVLIFHDQPFTDEQQIAFTRELGPIEDSTGGHVAKPEERRLGALMNDVSNLGLDYRPLARDDRKRMFNLGNRLWHSDSSFRVVPARYSLLSGRIVAKDGGNTEFADMRAAYDALDPKTKDEIEDLVCEHSLMYSRGSLGFDEFTAEERVMFRPVRQRLVRIHPVTGRKSLYLSSHLGTIVGWPVPEARAFIRDLTEHATEVEFVYVHRWRTFDFVMWDNRQTMHRVRRFDDSEVRDMRRTTVAGDQPTAAQVAAE
ncbi:MAG: TauD/TfdA dioxygenase family protein [Acetobacteraceae bacterium]